jgi:hypothetical protein
MSDDAYGATLAKRRLSRHLLQLRVKCGYTANHVCDMLTGGGWSRFEANQWKRRDERHQRLAPYLRCHPRVGKEDRAIRSRARPWWRDCAESSE